MNITGSDSLQVTQVTSIVLHNYVMIVIIVMLGKHRFPHNGSLLNHLYLSSHLTRKRSMCVFICKDHLEVQQYRAERRHSCLYNE